MSSSEVLVLPERMAQYVDAGRLRDNFHNHPESQKDLSAGQQLAVQEIRARLEQLPLFHYTDSGDFPGRFMERGILPSSRLSGCRTNTYGLDRHFGLDQFVFSSLYLRNAYHYGAKMLSIDPQLKIIDTMLVTPHDLNDTVHTAKTDPNNLSKEDCRKIDAYFDSMMFGADWLDILARQALDLFVEKMRTSRDEVEEGVEMALLPLGFDLCYGEWKHYGAIDPGNIVDTYDCSLDILENPCADGDVISMAWLPHGLVLSKYCQLDDGAVLSTWHDVLSNHDVKGVDVKALRQFWKCIGELALS